MTSCAGKHRDGDRTGYDGRVILGKALPAVLRKDRQAEIVKLTGEALNKASTIRAARVPARSFRAG
jgi:hypothetical protein